jgi:hypothetical protein
MSVMNDYQSIHGGDKTIHIIESYTTAGIHEHQRKNDGYSLITTDEGHRLIASIQQKQAKGDSERALLCKFWGGVGDSVALLAGNRGLNQTSMSICHVCCYIQPNLLMNELTTMCSDDGFLDRILFFVNRPALYKTSTQMEANEHLKETGYEDFNTMFKAIDQLHRDSTTEYTLDDDARTIYHEYADEFVDFMCTRWANEDDEEDVTTGTLNTIK